MGALAIGAAIGTIGSLIGTSMASESAESTNSQAMSFTAGENQANRQFQSAMYERQQVDEDRKYNRRFQMQQDASKELTDWLYRNYNSPSAQVSALRQAGINPSAAFASGGNGFVPDLQSSPDTSAPIASGMSPSTSNSVSLTPPGQYFAGSVKEIASAFAEMSSGSKSLSEAKTIESTRDAIVTDYVLRNNGQQIANDVAHWHKILDLTFSDRRIRAELKQIEANAFLAYNKGETEQAQKYLLSLQSKIAEYQNRANQEMLPYLAQNAKNIALGFVLDNKVKKSQEIEHYASASESSERATTERENRPNIIAISKNQALDIANKAKISSADMEKALLELQKTRNLAAWRKKWPNLSREIDEFRYITGSDVGKTTASGGNGMSVLAGYLLKALK